MAQKSLLRDLSVIMVQESITQNGQSSADILAKHLGWKSYSQKRSADDEGLGFVYSPTLAVTMLNVRHLKSRHSSRDYQRMALAMQVRHPVLGLVRFVNTHLAHEPTMGATRKAQLLEVLAWVGELENVQSSNLILFGGDFNTGPFESYYRGELEVLRKSKFGFYLAPSQGASFTWIDKKANLREVIDHFFMAVRSPQLRIGNFLSRIYAAPTDENLSDHNLVISEVHLCLFERGC